MEILTVRERGWGSLRNGKLLEAADKEFDVLVTMDRGIPYQQGLSRLEMGLVILEAKSNRLADLEPLMHDSSDAVFKAASAAGKDPKIIRVGAHRS